jgi:hypothetical protein
MTEKGAVETGPVPVATPGDLLPQAEDANSQEHHLTISQAFKLYPKAIAWSLFLSMALVMDGYDLKLIGSLFAQPAFQKAYGRRQPKGNYQIPAPWQAGLNNGSIVGQICGLAVAGLIVERIGFRRTMMAALAVVPCFVFIQFFAPNLPVLQVGQILLGTCPVPCNHRPETNMLQAYLWACFRPSLACMQLKSCRPAFEPSSQAILILRGCLVSCWRRRHYVEPFTWQHLGPIACHLPYSIPPPSVQSRSIRS